MDSKPKHDRVEVYIARLNQPYIDNPGIVRKCYL